VEHDVAGLGGAGDRQAILGDLASGPRQRLAGMGQGLGPPGGVDAQPDTQLVAGVGQVHRVEPVRPGCIEGEFDEVVARLGRQLEPLAGLAGTDPPRQTELHTGRTWTCVKSQRG
jgi:hypothetical protein